MPYCPKLTLCCNIHVCDGMIIIHYLFHHTYRSVLSNSYRFFFVYAQSLAITQDRLEVTFIPSGFDTIDLINIQCGLKLVSREYAKSFILDLTKANQSLTTLALKPNDEASNSNSSSEFKELESEQQWLDGLSQFISQLSLNGASSSTNLATTGSMKLNSSSLSLNALESQSFTSSDANTNITNIISSTNTNTVTKEGALLNDPNKPPPPVVSRRASVRSSSIATEKKDVGDFFKNLLKK